MKVLLINGSPHERGCTYTALHEVAGVLQAKGIETEIFWIGKEPIQGCTACGACKKIGRCAFDRDGVNLCREKLAQADGLVLGSPVYYGAIAGGMKCFLDRLFYAGKPPRYKVGAAVCTLRRGGGIAAYDQLLSYLQLSEMVLAPTRYWQAVHGNTPQELAQDLEGMQTLRETAASMAWLLESLHRANLPAPQPEQPKRGTNFIR